MKINSNPPNEPPDLEELRRRQRNTLWPDTFANSRVFYTLLWKGSPDATLVQRIGMGLLGVIYLLEGYSFFATALAVFQGDYTGALKAAGGAGFLLLAGRACRNAFLRG